MEQTDIKRFSEEYPSGTQFEAEKVELSDVLGKDIVIKDVSELSGSFGNFIVVLAELNSIDIQFATGSGVIMPKLLKAKAEEKLPLIAKIVERTSEKTKRTYCDIE